MFGSSSNRMIVGPSGSGKTVHAVHFALSKVTMGTAVVIFDSAASYSPIVRTLGGTVASYDGVNWNVTSYGSLPVTVYQLELCNKPLDIGDLPGLIERSRGALFVLDESPLITKLLPGLLDVMLDEFDNGGSVCLVGQTIDDVGGRDVPDDTRLLVLGAKHQVADEFMAQPEQFYRHKDGGIYQLLGLGKHTDDPEQRLRIYSHVWPFEAGALWARPESEWWSRFTLMTRFDVFQEMQKDRVAAQDAVRKAKERRRAAAATSHTPANV